MKLVSDWSRVHRRASSVWLSAFNAVIGFAAYGIPALRDSVSPRDFLALMAVIAVLTALSRIIKQRSVSDGDS